MHLTELLDRACVKVPLQAADKRGAIEELVKLLAEHKGLTDAGAVLDAVLQRESTRTTGIGNGLAIPHGKCPGVTRLVMALGKPAEPIEFDAIDGKPVNVIILLASPVDQAGPHIQALARVSRLMTMEPCRLALDKAATAEEAFQIIARYEDVTHPAGA